MTIRRNQNGIMLFSMLIMLCLPGLAQAEAIEIDSGKMTFQHKKNEAEFTENVHLTRDNFELWCDRLVTYFKDNKLERANAFGHVKIKQNEMTGHSERAVLDQIEGTMTLIGKAVLEQNGSRVEGETVIYDTRNERTLVKPVSGGRTHMVIETDDQGMSLPSGKPDKQETEAADQKP